MHCLVVTIFYCIDNHFTSFVAILLLLTMVYNEFYYILYVQYMGKTACYVYRIGYQYRLFFKIMSIGYRKTENFDIGTPLVLSLYMYCNNFFEVLVFKMRIKSTKIFHYMVIISKGKFNTYLYKNYIHLTTQTIYSVVESDGRSIKIVWIDPK